jgi:Fic family protein
MDVLLFSKDQQQHLIKTIAGAYAFVPPPLPPKNPSLDYSEFALELGLASAAIGELKGAARRLANPYMLVMPLIQKEALTSSAMEGTITTIESMIIEQATPDSDQDENAREASNYVRAVRRAIEKMEEYPISHRLIKDAHKTLLSGLSPARGEGKRPGEYKTTQNAIGQRGDTEHTARYVPPPPAETATAMDALERFINREDRKQGEELIDLALVHYQFEAIHPFLDGNGRMGRMLITLMAVKTGLMDSPLLHLSAEMEKEKEEYIKLLFDVSTHARWERWIKHFLVVTKRSCESATKKVDEILELEQVLKARAMARKKNHRLNTIIESLFEKHWITAPEAQKLCGTHFQTAQSDLELLVEAGILSIVEGRRPQLYVAREIWTVSNR